MLTKIITIFMVAVFCLMGTAFAEPYQVSLEVKDTSNKTLQLALPRAFAKVLVNVSGDADVVNQQVIKEALNKTIDYVSQYRYRDRQLEVEFNEPGVLELLARVGPKKTVSAAAIDVLLWLVVDGELVTVSSDQKELRDQLTKAAKQYNVPVMLPVMDLAESLEVKSKDVEDFSPQVVKHSQDTYKAENIVLAIISKQPDGLWQGHWALYWRDDEYKGSLTGLSLDHVLQPMMETLAMSLQENSRQAEISKIPTLTKVHVKGIDGLDEFADVVEYLRAVPSVEEVEVIDVYTDALALEVKHRGDAARLNRLLRRTDRLVMMPGDDVFDEVLTYHWGS